jgi:hypothetical protein
MKGFKEISDQVGGSNSKENSIETLLFPFGVTYPRSSALHTGCTITRGSHEFWDTLCVVAMLIGGCFTPHRNSTVLVLFSFEVTL